MFSKHTTGTAPTAALARRAALEQHLARTAEGGPSAIHERLIVLDREWTSGRMAKVTIGLTILAGLLLAVFVNPWFAVAPAVGGLLLVQYLFARRSWLGELFQRAGYRCGLQIEEERITLKALRGDYKHLPTLQDIEDRDAISRLEGEGGMVVEPDAAKIDPQEAVRQVVEVTHH